MTWPVTIYGMVDWVRPDVVRYVGKTQESLIKRLRTHFGSVNRHRCPKNDWIKHLFLKGSFPVMVPIEVCDASIWKERERFWISELRKQFPLLNVAEGGECGPSRKGCKQPAHVGIIARLTHLGRKLSTEAASKLRLSRLGSRHSPESLRKMSAAMKQYRADHPEYVADLNAKFKIASAKRIGVPRPSHIGAKIIATKIQNGTLRSGINAASLARQKPVRCIGTGEEFQSIKTASVSKQLSNTAIYQALSYGCRAGGHYWERINRVPVS